jgi:hypothetical protein
MEAAERAKLEEEIRAKQEEVSRIQQEVEIKDTETRRLQEEVEDARRKQVCAPHVRKFYNLRYSTLHEEKPLHTVPHEII